MITIFKKTEKSRSHWYVKLNKEAPTEKSDTSPTSEASPQISNIQNVMTNTATFIDKQNHPVTSASQFEYFHENGKWGYLNPLWDFRKKYTANFFADSKNYAYLNDPDYLIPWLLADPTNNVRFLGYFDREVLENKEVKDTIEGIANEDLYFNPHTYDNLYFVGDDFVYLNNDFVNTLALGQSYKILSNVPFLQVNIFCVNKDHHMGKETYLVPFIPSELLRSEKERLDIRCWLNISDEDDSLDKVSNAVNQLDTEESQQEVPREKQMQVTTKTHPPLGILAFNLMIKQSETEYFQPENDNQGASKAYTENEYLYKKYIHIIREKKLISKYASDIRILAQDYYNKTLPVYNPPSIDPSFRT